jgi:type I restriction enzyme S subunit
VEQERIAGVLSALDDLIENNRRRVELLEQMAQAIYREWLVHFRYPGHEEAPLVDSRLGPIPEGWRVWDLGEVVELRYGKALKKDARRGGMVAVLGSSGVVGWHDEMLIAGPSIIVGRKGNVGSVTWVDGPSWPIDTTYYVVTPFPPRYVVEQLRRTEFLNTHAAVPGLSRAQAYSRPFLQPPSDLMVSFSEVSDGLASQASALASHSERLGAIRDLLLPKLVTGEIDVSGLDLDALVESVA